MEAVRGMVWIFSGIAQSLAPREPSTCDYSIATSNTCDMYAQWLVRIDTTGKKIAVSLFIAVARDSVIV